MIPISPRLLTCASMITGRVVCDVGTDHAYLPVWLIQTGKAVRVIATDIRKGPLQAAEETIRRFGIADGIELILSDGFDNVRDHSISDAVIAGMGGETIRDILAADSAAFLKNGVNLVLQPMTKSELLRVWLAENGYAVTRETAVKDNKIYCIIQAKYTGKIIKLSEAESYFGTLDPADPMTKVYIAEIQKHLLHRADGLKTAGDADNAEHVRMLIAEIDGMMNRTEETNENTAGL